MNWSRKVILSLLLMLSIFKAGGQGIKEKLQAVYTQEIGVSEVGADNHGPKIAEYLSLCGLPEGYPWCGGFTTYPFYCLGLDFPKGSCGSYNWFKDERTYYIKGEYGKNVARTADLFGLYYRKLGRIGHIGFIDQDGGDYYVTVEGNTNDHGSREGDAVFKKRRLKRSIYALADWTLKPGYLPK